MMINAPELAVVAIFEIKNNQKLHFIIEYHCAKSDLLCSSVSGEINKCAKMYTATS